MPILICIELLVSHTKGTGTLNVQRELEITLSIKEDMTFEIYSQCEGVACGVVAKSEVVSLNAGRGVAEVEISLLEDGVLKGSFKLAAEFTYKGTEFGSSVNVHGMNSGVVGINANVNSGILDVSATLEYKVHINNLHHNINESIRPTGGVISDSVLSRKLLGF